MAGSGQSYFSDAPAEVQVRLPVCQAQFEVHLAVAQQPQRHGCRAGLRDDGGPGGTDHAHARKWSYAVDHQGVEHDIDDVRERHHLHRGPGVSDALHGGIAQKEYENGEAASQRDIQVTQSGLNNILGRVHPFEDLSFKEESCQGHEESEEQRYNEHLSGGFGCHVMSSLAGEARHHGDDAHRCAHHKGCEHKKYGAAAADRGHRAAA